MRVASVTLIYCWPWWYSYCQQCTKNPRVVFCSTRFVLASRGWGLPGITETHTRSNSRGWPPPPLVRSIQRGVLDCTHYAKGRYAVRENPVLSFADIIFYFKRSNFHQKAKPTWIQSQFTLNFSRARFVRISAFVNINNDFGRSKIKKSNKQIHQS